MSKLLEIDLHNKRALSGLLLVFIATISLSLLGIIAKISFNHAAKPIELLFWRTLFCVVFLWIVSLITLKESRINEIDRNSFFFALLAGFVGHYFTAISGLSGLEYITAAQSGLLYSSYPMFVIILDAFLKKKLPERKHITAVLMSLVGIYLIIGGDGHYNLKGSILTILSSFASACFLLMNHKIASKTPSLAFVTLSMTGGLIGTCLHYFFTEKQLPTHQFDFTFFCFFLSAIFCAGGFIMLSKGITRIGAGRAAILTNSSPFFAVVFAFLLLGEKLGFIQLLGGAIILSTIFFLERRTLVLMKNKKLS